MSLHPRRIFAGFLLSMAIGIAAYRRRSLSRSGIAGATITGTATFGFGGWSWGLALIFFFLSSSVLSHFRASDKERTAADKFSKGGQRDIAQAMANGGVATVLSLTYGLVPITATKARSLLEAGYVGALATANADTWATELGVLSKQPPRLITTGKLTTPGTSGGITLLGSSAAGAGALALGLWFVMIRCVERAVIGAAFMTPALGNDSASSSESVGEAGVMNPARTTRRLASMYAIPVIAFVSGLMGAMFDSVLGATVQAMYFCPRCLKETERKVHSCGTETRLLRGVEWVDNDVVNFVATLMGSVVAMVVRLFW